METPNALTRAAVLRSLYPPTTTGDAVSLTMFVALGRVDGAVGLDIDFGVCGAFVGIVGIKSHPVELASDEIRGGVAHTAKASVFGAMTCWRFDGSIVSLP